MKMILNSRFCMLLMVVACTSCTRQGDVDASLQIADFEVLARIIHERLAGTD